MTTRRRILYFIDEHIAIHASPEASLRKPHVVRLADELVKAYGLHDCLTLAACGKRWEPAPAQTIRRFHTDAYVHFLEQIELHGKDVAQEAASYCLNPSVCFSETAWPYSQVYTGASMAAAQSLATREARVAINWSGGQTHARRDCASGFSYVNDVVLAILQLLQVYERVLFVNVDATHASGVEEAFYTTDRVLFISLHRRAEGVFPGSGGAKDVGELRGKLHNINLPVAEGLTDADLEALLAPVLGAASQRYQPHVVVACAGTGILSGDRLGCMNVSLDGYVGLVHTLISLDRPTLLLGGSGYTQSTAARAWCAATAAACELELKDAVPEHDFYSYYAPTFRLTLEPTTMSNYNSAGSLAATRDAALATLDAMLARDRDPESPHPVLLDTPAAAMYAADGDEARAAPADAAVAPPGGEPAPPQRQGEGEAVNGVGGAPVAGGEAPGGAAGGDGAGGGGEEMDVDMDGFEVNPQETGQHTAGSAAAPAVA